MPRFQIRDLRAAEDFLNSELDKLDEAAGLTRQSKEELSDESGVSWGIEMDIRVSLNFEKLRTTVMLKHLNVLRKYRMDLPNTSGLNRVGIETDGEKFYIGYFCMAHYLDCQDLCSKNWIGVEDAIPA